jgi:heme-degrading monooxygenase HmoA
MYIRLNMFSVGSGKRAEFEQLADRFAPIFRAQKGFKSVTFFEADAAVATGRGWSGPADARDTDPAHR